MLRSERLLGYWQRDIHLLNLEPLAKCTEPKLEESWKVRFPCTAPGVSILPCNAVGVSILPCTAPGVSILPCTAPLAICLGAPPPTGKGKGQGCAAIWSLKCFRFGSKWWLKVETQNIVGCIAWSLGRGTGTTGDPCLWWGMAHQIYYNHWNRKEKLNNFKINVKIIFSNSLPACRTLCGVRQKHSVIYLKFLIWKLNCISYQQKHLFNQVQI